MTRRASHIAVAFFAVVTLAAWPFTPGQANPLDDCTLKNMAGVTSDAAAKFVRQSCLGQISTLIPPEELLIKATAAMGPEQYKQSNHLYVTIQNNSPYAITQMMIRVATDKDTKWNDYEVTNFARDTVYFGEPPSDPTTYLQIKPFATVTFSFAIREPNLPQGDMELECTFSERVLSRSMSVFHILQYREADDGYGEG